MAAGREKNDDADQADDTGSAAGGNIIPPTGQESDEDRGPDDGTRTD